MVAFSTFFSPAAQFSNKPASNLTSVMFGQGKTRRKLNKQDHQTNINTLSSVQATQLSELVKTVQNGFGVGNDYNDIKKQFKNVTRLNLSSEQVKFLTQQILKSEETPAKIVAQYKQKYESPVITVNHIKQLKTIIDKKICYQVAEKFKDQTDIQLNGSQIQDWHNGQKGRKLNKMA